MLPAGHLSLAIVLGALALPQAAQAADLAPLKPCFVSVDEETREPVPVEASGFTPGASVDVAIDGAPVGTVAVLPDGRVIGRVSAPHQERGERPFTLTVTERDRPESAVSTTSRVTALGLRMVPDEASPRRRVRFIGRGFTEDRPVYGHYVRGGELRKTVRFGRPTGACGRFSVKRRQIPVRRPRVGRWTLQVDHRREYSQNPEGVAVRLAITVRRVFRNP
jgi:hypothetical protein